MMIGLLARLCSYPESKVSGFNGKGMARISIAGLGAQLRSCSEAA